jgi:hypothetical protein
MYVPLSTGNAGVGRPFKLSHPFGCDSILFHQPRHSLAVDPLPVKAQPPVDLRTAISAAILSVNRCDPLK